MDIYTLLIYVSIVLLAGFAVGKFVEHYGLPAVTGYLIAGVLIGPYGIGIVSMRAVEAFDVITKLVLGVIAFQIGTELFIPVLKKSGKRLLSITFVHAFITYAIVWIGVYLLSGELWIAFALSGLAVASAPAPVMEVIKKLRAKGPLKSTIVPVVGLLDIVSVIIFGLSASIALSLLDGESININNAFFEPVTEVVLSIFVGILLGALLGVFSKLFVEKAPKADRYLAYLVISLSFILFSTWLANVTELSNILIPMSMGMAFTNFIDKETFEIQGRSLQNFGGPFFVLFFTIAGLSLSPTIVVQAASLATVFIVLRAIGKIGGAYVASTLTACPTTVKRYTGMGLLPQAGVTIGMLVSLSASLPPEETQLIQAVVLSSILIFQIIGPVVLQRVLIKAGEARTVPGGKTNPQSDA